jgi:DNA-binding beta-propeller fold protein YncE
MKSHSNSTLNAVRRASAIFLFGTSVLVAIPANGQLFVTDFGKIGEYTLSGEPVAPALVTGLDAAIGTAMSGSYLYVANTGGSGHGPIGEYTTSGATVNASLITTASNGPPFGIAVAGGNVFVANFSAGTVSEYDATTGAVKHSSLIAGLNNPVSIAVSGSTLYVGNQGSNTIGEYTISGATIRPTLVSGLQNPQSIAVSDDGAYLYVTNENGGGNNGTVGKYTTSGVTVAAPLISGLNTPDAVAVYGDELFVGSFHGQTVGEFTTSGAIVDAALISVTGRVTAITIGSAVPEPSTLIVLALAGLLVCFRQIVKKTQSN